MRAANNNAQPKKGKGKIVLIIVVVILVLGMIGSCGNEKSTSTSTSSSSSQTTTSQNGVDKSLLESIVKNAKSNDGSEFTAESFATLTAAIESAETVLADGDATQEQVDEARNAVTDAVSALVEADAATMGEKNALSSAHSYLNVMGFSCSGLIEQLEFEGYTTEEATYAADNCGADWNEQAAIVAESYINTMSFSRNGLIDQLLFEGFTQEQAEYGASAVGY